MLIEGPADGGSDVNYLASMVSLDKRQSGRRMLICTDKRKGKS